jgi:hypothetical protein
MVPIPTRVKAKARAGRKARSDGTTPVKFRTQAMEVTDEGNEGRVTLHRFNDALYSLLGLSKTEGTVWPIPGASGFERTERVRSGA